MPERAIAIARTIIPCPIRIIQCESMLRCVFMMLSPWSECSTRKQCPSLHGFRERIVEEPVPAHTFASNPVTAVFGVGPGQVSSVWRIIAAQPT